MSNYPVGRPPRSADPHSKLRIAALSAVSAGVVLLAAAAFVLSYSGIHVIALRAGVSHGVAKLYPVTFDAMLVVAGAAAMALRGAGWWARFYAWATLIILLAAVATGDALHATNTSLPVLASRAAFAVIPWVLVLLAFGLLLEMLRHFRKARAVVVHTQQAAALAAAAESGYGVVAAWPSDARPAAQPAAQQSAALPPAEPAAQQSAALPPAEPAAQQGDARPAIRPADAGPAARTADAGDTAGTRKEVSWKGAAGAGAASAGKGAGAAGTDAGTGDRPPSETHASLVDLLLGPRPGQPPAVETPDETAGHDPVSYGAETGYVHPDSYKDEGEYSPHGDSGGPGFVLIEPAPANGNQPANANQPAGGAGPAGTPERAQAGEPGPEPGQDGEPVQSGMADEHEEAGTGDDHGQAGEPEKAEPRPGKPGQDDAAAKPAEAEDAGLERVRSSPTRP